jgi:peptidoglycan/LPS O-acetylase OafA/YrhL
MPVLLRFFQASFAPNARVPAASGSNDHYLGLDFLRGVAALAVLCFHSSTRFNLPYLFPHGYLAVDFFFALSGFVIARAYQARISSGRLPILQFALMRVIRLMPLIVLGTLVAAIGEFARPGIIDQHQHLIDAISAFLLGLVLIPTLYPNSLTFTVFPLNGPAWSLFLEAAANGAFAIWAWIRPGIYSLALICIISALGLLSGAYLTGKMDFGAVRDDFWLGFARVGWSFSLGVILFRFRHRAPQTPFIVPACLLISVLLTPSLGAIDAAFDSICVLFVLPWIVWLASAAQFGSRGQRWSAWSGDLSYPIYALHYPLLRYFGGGGAVLQLSLLGRSVVACLATLVVLMASAAAYALFDVPVRRWLSRKLGL